FVSQVCVALVATWGLFCGPKGWFSRGLQGGDSSTEIFHKNFVSTKGRQESFYCVIGFNRTIAAAGPEHSLCRAASRSGIQSRREFRAKASSRSELLPVPQDGDAGGP